MRILAIGPLWRGSNAGGLFRAMSRQGCIIEIIDEFYYISMRSRNNMTKIFEKFIRPIQAIELNNYIVHSIFMFKPDILFVYKGTFVFPDTLKLAKNEGCKLILFYPDVSMVTHGGNIKGSVPLYDVIFTTKTFGIKDLESKFNYHNACFVPHGFDPEIHRKIDISDKDKQIFCCDVSFIGTWSHKKEILLSELKQRCPTLEMKIWGDQWNRVKSPILRSSIQNTSVLGDLYAIAIQCSKINLGLLSEKIKGASSGDLITSRTFHITGSSGFLLHERNEESVLYYTEDEEAVFFSDIDDLVSKVEYYLNNNDARLYIQQKGYEKALSEHSLDARATIIIKKINEIILI